MAVRAPWTIPHCHDAIPSMRRCSSLSDAARGGVRGQPTVGGPDPRRGSRFRLPPDRPHSHAHARRGRFESRRSSGGVTLRPGLRRRASICRCGRHHGNIVPRAIAPPNVPSTAIAALCVQAIWMTSAHSTSSRGLAPSMNAKLAFTAVSEIPLPGNRAAAISCCREAATNAPEAVPKAFLRRCHHSGTARNARERARTQTDC